MGMFRDNIERLRPYVPGEQPPPGARVIKLNTNENPYPPSPRAVAALRGLEADLLRRYPHPYAAPARRAAADLFGVATDRVLLGNGSDELLTMLVRAAAGPGRPVAYAMPTYVLYRTLAQIQRAEVVEVPYDEDYRLPADALVAARAAVTLVASPNSPSGTSAATDQLAELARGCDGLVVIDEAYVDFAEGDAMGLAGRFDNVLVLRTLSKGYSLAGLRLGFAVGHPAIIEGLAKVKDSYNVGAAACAAGAAAIADQDWKNANAEKVKASRGRLSDDLAALGFRVWPSQSNFLLARPPAGDAERLYRALKDRGILVRYFQQAALDDKLRISVGADADNAALVGALRTLL
jgi:histidinol-phosphate aminotransferase